MSRADEIREKAQRIRAARPDAAGVAELRTHADQEVSSSGDEDLLRAGTEYVSISSPEVVLTSVPGTPSVVLPAASEEEVSTSSNTRGSGSGDEDALTEGEEELRGHGDAPRRTPVPPYESKSVTEDISSYLRSRPPRVRTVRLSVDIAPAEHRELVDLGTRLADDLGVTRVHNQEMMHALLRMLLSDAAIVERVLADIDRRRRQSP